LPTLYTGGRSGDAIWFDDFALMGGTSTEDFSGDTPGSGDVLYRWTGAPGASASQQYIAETPRPPETIQGPLFKSGGVITTAGKPIDFTLGWTWDGDTPDDEWFRYGWQDDAHTVAVAQPLNPIEAVRFIRGADIDTGVPVRSGNDALAPDGEAYAFDMEAPLGSAAIWSAYPVYADGSLGDPTDSVSLVTVKPGGFYDTWLKSVADPGLSRRVLLTKDNIPVFTKASRISLNTPLGSSYSVGSQDVHVAATTTLTAYTSTEVEQDDMEKLLASGTLLFQTLPEYHVADFYFLVGDIEMALTGAGTGSVSRRWTIPATVIARPTPLGAPLVIPGGSYDETDVTYDQLAVNFDTYDYILEVA
jgi:hypothetical protein